MIISDYEFRLKFKVEIITIIHQQIRLKPPRFTEFFVQNPPRFNPSGSPIFHRWRPTSDHDILDEQNSAFSRPENEIILFGPLKCPWHSFELLNFCWASMFWDAWIRIQLVYMDILWSDIPDIHVAAEPRLALKLLPSYMTIYDFQRQNKIG